MATDRPRYMISIDDDLHAKIECYKQIRNITKSKATEDLIRIGIKSVYPELNIEVETVPVITLPTNALMMKKVQLLSKKRGMTLEQTALYLVELGYMALSEKRKRTFSRSEILLASKFEELTDDTKIQIMQLLNDDHPKLMTHPGDVEYAYSNIEDVGALIAAYSVASPEAQNQVREILGIPHEIDAHEDVIDSAISQATSEKKILKKQAD